MGKVWTVIQRKEPGAHEDTPRVVGQFVTQREADAEWRRITLAGGKGYVVQSETDRWEG